MKGDKTSNRYRQIIEDIFLSRFRKGQTRVLFGRVDIEHAAAKLKIALPKNIGDLRAPNKMTLPSACGESPGRPRRLCVCRHAIDGDRPSPGPG
jgi:hypothetical protein